MTQAKRNRGKSEKRVYSHARSSNGIKRHTVPAETIAYYFALIGWTGHPRGR